MPKRRKLDLSCNFIGGEDSYGLSEISSPAGLPIIKGVRPQKNRLLPSTNRSRYRSGSVTDALSQIGYGAENSGVLGLQLQKLLEKARRTDQARMTNAQDVVQELKQIIEQIPPRERMRISKAEKVLQQNDHVLIPFPEARPDEDARYTVLYDKPQDVIIIPSFAHDTDIEVELVLTMPSELFQDKDFLNHRYFYKRAYYLACLAAGIQKSKRPHFSLQFTLQNENPLQPIILFGPSPGGKSDEISEEKWYIRITLDAPEGLFPIAKTLPAKCCVRTSNINSALFESRQEPTPVYNATIRSECSTKSYHRLFDRASIHSEAFKDACILGGVWLRGRGLNTDLASGGFGQFEWTCVTALLLRKDGCKRKPPFPVGYSSFQLFKATLQFIAASNLCSDPLITGSESLESINQMGPVFFDSERGLNILFKMTEWSYKILQHEAKRTIDALREPFIDGFHCSFVSKVDDSLHRFDYCFSLAFVPKRDPLKNLNPYIEANQYCQEIYDTLSRGLSDRAELIHMQYCRTLPWSPGSPRCLERKSIDLFVGLLLNTEKCWQSIDHGPSADDQAASQEFRNFWGKKAELRRFKGGGILECVVWNSGDPKHSILDQIITYLLRQHTTVFLGSGFNQILPRRSSHAANPVMPFWPIITSFDALEKKVRGLDRLPLQIRQITAASPALCFTSLDIPNFDSNSGEVRFVDVNLQFEGSARWPEDMVAIQETKIAFLLKLGELLEYGTRGLNTKLGLENESKVFLNQAFLDIFEPLGAVFRVRVHHERELNILQSLMKNETSSFRRLDIASAISTYKRDFLQKPLHTEMVRTLSTRFPLLSPSIRLMKKWRDSHLLSGHIGDELIELLTIKTFVHPHPWPVPGSIMTGFLRTLSWITSWDWREEPLIVDFNHELSAQNIEDINVKYKAWRKIDPGMNRVAMFIASSLDPDGVTWTEPRPSKVAAARFSRLAISANSFAKKQGIHLRAEALFATSKIDYDFIIYINSNLLHKDTVEARNRKNFKNLDLQLSETVTSVERNPIQAFLAEATEMHGSNVLFFHNAHETLFIAGIWNPETEIRNWKVHVPYSSMPVLDAGSDDMKIVVNKAATLHDLARLGGSLVSKIDAKEQTCK